MDRQSEWDEHDRLIYWMEMNSWQEANQWREWRFMETNRLKQEAELHLQESRFGIQKCELAVRDLYREIQEYVQNVQHIVEDLRIQQRSLFEFMHGLQETLDYQRGCEWELKQHICVLEQSLCQMQEHNFLLQVQVSQLADFKERAIIEQAANESEHHKQICSLEEELFLMQTQRSMLEAREVSTRTSFEREVLSLQTSIANLNSQVASLLDFKRRHTRVSRNKRTRKESAAAAAAATEEGSHESEDNFAPALFRAPVEK